MRYKVRVIYLNINRMVNSELWDKNSELWDIKSELWDINSELYIWI